MNMSETLSLTLRELVDSGLSDCTLSLSHEGEQCPGGGTNDLRCVNAAKLSLLLARTLARLEADGRGGEEGVGNIDPNPSRLDLKDFVVQLARPSDVGKLDDVKLLGKARDEHDPVLENGDTQPLDFRVGILDEKDEAFDMPSVLFDGDDDAKPLDFKVDQMDNNNEALHFLSDFFAKYDADGFEWNEIETPLQTSEENSIQGANGSSLGTEPSRDRNTHPCDKDKFENINSTSGSDIHWILLGMEMRVDENYSAPKSLEETRKLLQRVGRMIHEIFSPSDIYNRHLPEKFQHLLVLEECSVENENNDESGSVHRGSKLRRCKEKSLFSDLLEAGQYPIAVCRLLSDMIDTSEGGTADTPFTTLEDVIGDLTQMSSHPRLYLNDPGDTFFSSGPRFGLRCYGRMGQVTSILGVASSLEGGNGGELPHSSERVECIFVSGIAGAGKSFLMQSIGDYLTNQGWIVLGTKFEMGLEHESQRLVFGAFDKLVATIVGMRDEGTEEDVEYGRLVVKAISNALDGDSMSSLAAFLPSIKELVDDVDEDHGVGDGAADSDKGNSHWRLIFLLSSLLGAILSVDRRIMIYFDDAQWSDTTLALISEVVISIGRLPHARNRFLFVAMYRDNELTDSHPFTSQQECLKRNKNVNVTCINLPSLSKNDIVDMMMAEMRLPRRFVLEFSHIIHKKTSGHALFVVQLLNSLVKDSIVVYSPTKKRFHWDRDRLNNLETWDSVASLIVSNLSSLPLEALSSLEVLSAFGMQTHQSIICHNLCCTDMQVGESGVVSFLPSLIDAGIIEEGPDSIIKFSHDLIRSAVYHGIAIDRRRRIHLRIGVSLGSNTLLDTPVQCHSIEREEKQKDSPIMSQSLFLIATDHINKGSELVTDDLQRVRFAGWNLNAATESWKNSNFEAALHYYKNGIAFIEGQLWTELCCSLHRGAAFASLALGKPETVPQYANAIITNVPFKRSLEAQYLLIRSLECSGSKNRETIATALSVLRQVGFDIPSAPKVWLSYAVGAVQGLSPSIIVQRMKKTDKVVSQYNLDKFIDRSEGSAKAFHKSKVDVLNICDSMILAGLRSWSPYIPLIVCETINYSLQNDCVCGESALSFSCFGYLKIWLEDDYDEGYRWGTMALKILNKAKHSPFIRTRFVLHSLVLPWNRSLGETAQEFFKSYELGMKFGDVASACATLALYFRFSLFNGDKLSSLQAKFDIYLKQIVMYNKEAAKMAVLSHITVHLLMGVDCNSFSIFDGMICDEDSLLVDALSKKNSGLIMGIYWRRFLFDFWMGNDSEARRWACRAMSYSKRWGPYVGYTIFTTLQGIIAFRMFRRGKGEKFFDEGKEILDVMEKWLERSENLVKDKVLILRAELYASTCEVKKAKETYERSIRAARNCGRVNDQGHAYELMGDYLASILEIPQATECYLKAHECYMQWGAVMKAKKIQEDHHLDLANGRPRNNITKHGRDWEIN